MQDVIYINRDQLEALKGSGYLVIQERYQKIVFDREPLTYDEYTALEEGRVITLIDHENFHHQVGYRK